MARRYDPQKAAEKQVRKVEGATQDYIDGVEAITQHPGKEAVKKKDKMKRKWLASVDSGKWQEGVESYDLEAYKRTARESGASRLAEGVRRAQPKIVEFHEQLSAHIDSTQAAIDAIDDSTEEGADRKMLENRKRMSRFKRVRRRR